MPHYQVGIEVREFNMAFVFKGNQFVRKIHGITSYLFLREVDCIMPVAVVFILVQLVIYPPVRAQEAVVWQVKPQTAEQAAKFEAEREVAREMAHVAEQAAKFEAEREVARKMAHVDVRAKAFCFSGKQFPVLDFMHPKLVQCWLGGTYTVKTKYFDAQFNEVTTADKPGRYGAIMEVTSHDGRVFRRFRTLYRMPRDVRWWGVKTNASVELVEDLGIDPAVEQRFSDEISSYVVQRFYSGLEDQQDMAILLAGLSEASAEDGTKENPWLVDHQWWVNLKRKLYGTDKMFPDPFVCPKALAGPPAPVVREGTLEEAGMSAEDVAAIDELCREWSENSDEAFAVCIVRNDVIVLHKAYGLRNGKPMTVNTPSRMASITKLICATTVLTAVDQGLVNLDDPVGDYLPPFAEIKSNKPLTLRRLLNHTSGLWGHWGSELADLEEILSEYSPYLLVGKNYKYNGTGLNLACKILESISGEAMESFYRNHLLDPLGCTGTSVSDGGGGAYGIPLDMAKIGQLLLNRGSYGDKQFFRPELMEELLPKPIDVYLDGNKSNQIYGLGCLWTSDDGLLPEDSFGHGAGSNATLRIIPSCNTVIVMCRNSRGNNISGPNFETYHHLFINRIARSIQDKEHCEKVSESIEAKSQPVYPPDDSEANRHQQKAANQLGIDKEMILDLGGGVTMKLVLIPAGTFTMGSPADEEGRVDTEGPQRQVTISKPFYMGIHEVTQEQYQAITGKKPSFFKGAKNPVELVNWNDAAEFCKALSHKTGRIVLLPSEAQWEYACRAGTTTPFNTGETISTDQANYNGYLVYGSGRKGKPSMQHMPVGCFPPNSFGLYDMHGNVWEWCTDWYADSYAAAENVDPTGPSSGTNRAIRGGSWRGHPSKCRSAFRGWGDSEQTDANFGFRVIVALE